MRVRLYVCIYEEFQCPFQWLIGPSPLSPSREEVYPVYTLSIYFVYFPHLLKREGHKVYFAVLRAHI